MTPSQWSRVKELFTAALEQPPPQRQRFLEEAVPDDPLVLAEVESLLASHTDDDFLETPVAVQPLITGKAGPTGEGSMVGPFQLVREIGRGGMGTVWEARRSDGEFEQRVAVKIIAPHLCTAAFARHFLAERRILASLEHPNIARLLDGGTTEDGLPWFAMELVDGLAIDVYCEQHQLPIERRLELIPRVCDAIDLAHRHLVVHRDIKPGNILVTNDGTPKLLDFGIAKLIETERGEDTHWTGLGLQPLTPAYASPEHLRGEPVSMASDVYSLGVLLYTLITGDLPYPESGKRPESVLRAIATGPPPRPSRRAGVSTGNRRRRRHSDDDLDAIVLKALAAEPDQRYASARLLAEDLLRYRRHQPIQARHPSAMYRLGRFMRRHRLAVVAALALIALTLNTVAQSIRYTNALRLERNEALAARDRAERKELEARAAVDFLIDIFDQPSPLNTQGRELSALDILKAGSERLQRELHDQPLVRARLLDAIGRVYLLLGADDRAEALLAEAFEQRHRLLGERDIETAGSLVSLAMLECNRSRWQEAAGHCRQALAIQVPPLGEHHPEVAMTRTQLALALRAGGGLEEAEMLTQQALADLRDAWGDSNRQVLRAAGIRAQVLTGLGRFDEAEEVYRDLVERQSMILGESDPYVAATLNNLAYLNVRTGRLAEAERLYRRSLEIALPVLGEDHPRITTTLQNLAGALAKQGRLREAEAVLRRLLESKRRVLGPADMEIGVALVRGVGNILLAQQRWVDAEPPLREGLGILEQTLGPREQLTAFTHGYLAASLYGQRRHGEASQHLEAAMAVLSEVRIWNSEGPTVLSQIAGYLEQAGEPDRAAMIRTLARTAGSSRAGN